MDIKGLSREDAFAFFNDIVEGLTNQKPDCTGWATIHWPLTDYEDRRIRAYITARDALNPKAIEREKDMDNTEQAKDEVRAVAKVLREARNKFPNKRIFTIEISAQAADYLVDSLELLVEGRSE